MFKEAPEDGLSLYEKNLVATQLKLSPFMPTNRLISSDDYMSIDLTFSTLSASNEFEMPYWHEKDADNKPTVTSIYGNLVIRVEDCCPRV